MDTDDIPVLEKLIKQGQVEPAETNSNTLEAKIQDIIDKHSKEMMTDITELLKKYRQ